MRILGIWQHVNKSKAQLAGHLRDGKSPADTIMTVMVLLDSGQVEIMRIAELMFELGREVGRHRGYRQGQLAVCRDMTALTRKVTKTIEPAPPG